MALDTARTITNLRSLTNRFDTGAETAEAFWPEIAKKVDSTGADEEYGGLGAVPGVREWLGDRVFQKLRGAKFTIENRDFEISVEIDKNDIDDARMVKYDSVLEEMGAEFNQHPDELMFELIVNGETSPCFDGQAFYDTDHAWGDSGIQSNDLSAVAATGTTPTEAEFRTAYHAARTALLSFKRDNGKLYHRPTIRPLTDLLLLVPPQHEEIAVSALTKSLVNQGETNIVLDRPRIVAVASFTADKFHLLRTGQRLKPFIFQARRPISRKMKGLDDPEFKNVKFMADARYNAGYLAWWNATVTTWT